MNYSALREQPSQFLSLISLHVAEFDGLLTDFDPAWERYHRYHTLDGVVQRQPAHQERANAVLAGTDTKLFFLLPYLKGNLLQQHQAASFGVSQTHISRLTIVLLVVLDQVLARRGLLFMRDGPNWPSTWWPTWSRSFPAMGSSAAFLATPTVTGRWQNTVLKKAHRLKNLTLCNDTQYVHFLGHGSQASARQETGRRVTHGQHAAPGPGAAGACPGRSTGGNAPQEAIQAQTDVLAKTPQAVA